MPHLPTTATAPTAPTAANTPSTRSSRTVNPASAAPADPGAGKVDNGALPNDGEHTVSQPEPQRESAAAQHEKPATGITPSGAAGGRRM